MKGFIALALALVPQALARPLEIPLHLALSYDEEVGCLGVPALIRACRRARRARFSRSSASRARCGSPMRIRASNSCAPRSPGTRRIRARPSAGSTRSPRRRRSSPRSAGSPPNAGLRPRPDSGFDPPYTSFNIGRIEGGTAVNIIARDCAFEWEFRTIPGEDGAALQRRIDDFVNADLLPRMRAGHPDAKVETETAALVPPLVPDPDSPAEALARVLTGANTTTTIAFATEAGLFQAAGIPAVICGPGSIEVAHQPDEFITRDQLAAGAAFLDRLLAWARGGER